MYLAISLKCSIRHHARHGSRHASAEKLDFEFAGEARLRVREQEISVEMGLISEKFLGDASRMLKPEKINLARIPQLEQIAGVGLTMASSLHMLHP
ncbi:hypothetical protein [Litoreibacter ascidiaceicola]|uniref:hypothetical protein n=1 Tax=Litoreibacter ascidiaceicola TaxID=1486859 RepID=UPI001115022D|nr:hypothetical protein [Litoreibacter ascidiaceicola]